jgi:hypothetical protein
MKENEFPVLFDTTQLDGAIPRFASNLGYDLPASIRISNFGSPKFTFDEDY